MTSRNFMQRAALMIGLAWLAGAANAGSVIFNYSQNGLALRARAASGFAGPGSVGGVDSGVVDNIHSGIPPAFLPVIAHRTQLPAFSTVPKDKAEIFVDAVFSAGVGGIPDDVIAFYATGMISAEDAHNSAGNPSDGWVDGLGSLEFYVDPVGVLPGVDVGVIRIPSLRPLELFETRYRVRVYRDPWLGLAPIFVVDAGGAGADVILTAGHGYRVVMDYAARVPFGIDPPFNASAIVTLIEAPQLCPGDLDCDGVIAFGDIDPFVEALSHPGGAGWPHPCPWLNGDLNGDDAVTFADIDYFVANLGLPCY